MGNWAYKGGKMVRKTVKTKYFILSESLVICAGIPSNHEPITDVALFKRNRERFDHGPSVLKSDSESLTVAL